MIYFPATCDILTPGHIKCLEWLKEKDDVIVGLLTDEALIGYKENVVNFEDRKYILETIAKGIGNIEIVSQETLNPLNNVKKYKCNAIASGDGWEPEELESIKKLKLEKIDIKLQDETNKLFSSSKVKHKIWKQKKSY